MRNSSKHITSQIIQLIEHIEANNHEHIAEELREQMQQSGITNFSSISIIECHVIAYIGKYNITNAISIAKYLKITRGGISKINFRLIQKGLIEAHQKEGNKREVFYTLTSLGKKVYFIHNTLHEKTLHSFRQIVETYNESEKVIISDFLNVLIEKI